VFDSIPTAPLERGSVVAVHPEAGLFDKLLGPALQAVDWSTRTVTSTWKSVSQAIRHPEQFLEQAEAVSRGAGMLVSELLKTPDPATPLKGEFGMQKRVAWSEPVAIADVKLIGAMSGAKVNDVLVAGMTGALRTYLAKRRVDVDHNTLRAMVPVDLRPRDRAIELGNAFGLVLLELAVGSKHPLERLRITKANMDALKGSPEAMAILTLFNIFGRGPKSLEDLAVDLFGSKASLVMTNVMGPREMLYLAGVPIDRIIFWVPHPGKQLGMGISIFSYKGAASLAVISDAHLVPDPEVITAQFNREFEKMLAMVRPVRAKQRRPMRERRRPGAKRAR
jgi:diacylglycerol O-acyltransferase